MRYNICNLLVDLLQIKLYLCVKDRKNKYEDLLQDYHYSFKPLFKSSNMIGYTVLYSVPPLALTDLTYASKAPLKQLNQHL